MHGWAGTVRGQAACIREKGIVQPPANPSTQIWGLSAAYRGTEPSINNPGDVSVTCGCLGHHPSIMGQLVRIGAL